MFPGHSTPSVPSSQQSSKPLEMSPVAIDRPVRVAPYPSRPNTPRATSKPPKSKTPNPPAPPPGDTPLQQRLLDKDNRPLNVTDALSYLDAVKGQFQDKPEVYNKFLDIMKDFKSQTLDTPGVIQRVSQLFHGFPSLIQGFNTFLPQGYRIDTTESGDTDTITVTTPSGTIIHSTTSAQPLVRTSRDIIPGFGPNIAQSFPGVPPPPLLPPLVSSRSASRPITPQSFPRPTAHAMPSQSALSSQPQAVPLQSAESSSSATQTNAAASFLGTLNKNQPVAKQSHEEFHHAIQYLNKIKSRYDENHNVYKQFLDILQTYQKEQNISSNNLPQGQVFQQVQHLFRDSPDLLVEFKQFLPEVLGQGIGGPAIAQPTNGSTSSNGQTWPAPDSVADKPAAKKVVTQTLKRKKRVPEKDPTPIPPPVKAKKPKLNHKSDPGSPRFSPYAHSPPPQSYFTYPHPPLPQQTIIPQMPHANSQASAYPPQNGSQEKFLFFERAKKTLDPPLYEDLLKLLSLLAKDIIDVKTLIEMSRILLEGTELWIALKEMVGWDIRQDNVESGPPGSIRTGPPDGLSAQPVDDGEGPSYRRVPESEIRLACSGRDEMCRSVLNDEWVSHPTWASEETGFITHRKNVFEEALHRSEEERHEYQVNLEALGRTIDILEPLSRRINEMTNEERSLFRLKQDFGGPGKAIYHRIIKKIYGRDNGSEVIQAMQECPSVTVPVVLERLKQKNEEWRRAQRDWGRTWKEVDAKNFYKSLDHQGQIFKLNDKKNITAKCFVAEIETIKQEQLENLPNNLPPSAQFLTQCQLEYRFEDTSVLHDSLKMVYSFLDRSQTQYSAPERRGIEGFLREFVPQLCMHSVAEFNVACGPQSDDDIGREIPTRSGRRSVGSQHSAQSNGINGVAAEDLRRKLLRTAQEKIANPDSRTSTSAAGSRAISPNLPEIRDDNDKWLEETSSHPDKKESAPSRPFFCNTTFYTLLRLLQSLYSRLLLCKEIGQELAESKHAILTSNPLAVDLGLEDSHGPAPILATIPEAFSDDAPNVVYMYLLDECEKVFAGELDQAAFEEHMRWFFGNNARFVFTLDKIMIALVKQVQTVLADSKCQELWSLLQSAQHSDVISNQDIIRYRREAECHVGADDHLYRIQWVPESKSIRLYLMTSDEPSVNSGTNPFGRWKEYVDTYVMNHPTEWIHEQVQEGRSAFLRRNIRVSKSETAPLSFEGEMRVRITLPGYKLLYEGGSEEAFYRVGPVVLKDCAKARRANGMWQMLE